MEEIFSETERQLLVLLGDQKMSILDITAKHYKNRKLPLNPNNVVSGAFNRINKKCKYFELDWFIDGEGLGRGGKVIWKAKMPKALQKKRK